MARKLVVEIVGDARSLERAFAKSSKSAKGFQNDMGRTAEKTRRGFGGIGKMAGFAAGAIGTAGLIGAAKAAFGEFQEGEKVTAQTAAAIESTGKAANVSAKQVEALAEAMMKKTGIDDEAIQTGENMLLTFTRIRNEVGRDNDIFDQATKATADLATAMAGGAIPSAENMQRAALQLGKALNDPVKGVGALRRVGIQFTKSQEKTIAGLAASGHMMEAQKLILAELNKEFGGRAAAAGKTFAGQWAIVRNTVLNLSATLVGKLMPSIQKLLEQLVKWLNNGKNQKKVLDTITAAAKAVETVVRALAKAFGVLSKITGGTKNALIVLGVAFAALKIAQFAASVRTTAAAFGLLNGRIATTTATTRTATVANRAFALSFLGKAGLVVGAGAAAFALTTLILKVTGLDKKLQSAGASAFDLAAKLGAVNDPTSQFAGKAKPTQGMIGFLRARAQRLINTGMTRQQAFERIAQTHPNVARRDIAVATAGLTMNVQGGVHLHGVQDPRGLESALWQRANQRPQRRRGGR